MWTPHRLPLPFFIPHIVLFGYPSSFPMWGNLGDHPTPSVVPHHSLTCTKTMSINVHIFRSRGSLLL
jgi:hypothetical protein